MTNSVSQDKIKPDVERLAKAFLPVMHKIHILASEAVKNTSFSLAQYRVLMLVYRYNSMTINQLRENLNIAQSTASEMIERLVRQGLLKREKNPDDRRITQFHLTGKTISILEEHFSSIGQIYHKILTPLSESQRSELVQAFETIQGLLYTDNNSNRDQNII